ncbi:hypothetical protein SDC9_185568 [bioreactor metagenome]|uniref:Uncharacterized protein n=1 Tax=bioreactor metagenome TaxID=1076179 RepID=A0A645HG77_9ZZZZ
MKAPLHAGADKAAIGAASGAEGNAHVQGDILGPQVFPHAAGDAGRLCCKSRPAGSNEILILQHPSDRFG